MVGVEVVGDFAENEVVVMVFGFFAAQFQADGDDESHQHGDDGGDGDQAIKSGVVDLGANGGDELEGKDGDTNDRGGLGPLVALGKVRYQKQERVGD